jgi:hypothetical protein
MQALLCGHPLSCWNFSICCPLHLCKFQNDSQSPMKTEIFDRNLHAAIGEYLSFARI